MRKEGTDHGKRGAQRCLGTKSSAGSKGRVLSERLIGKPSIKTESFLTIFIQKCCPHSVYMIQPILKVNRGGAFSLLIPGSVGG